MRWPNQPDAAPATGHSEEQVKPWPNPGETRRTLTFRSPVSGVITEKKAQGMRFMPGETLYQS